jgi:hypothetical protein
MPELEKDLSGSPGGQALTTAALREESCAGRLKPIATLPLGDEFRADICPGADSLWVLVRGRGTGGLALRTAYAPGPPPTVEPLGGDDEDKTVREFRVAGAAGEQRVRVETPAPGLLHCTVTLTPETDLTLPYWPRDLYALDNGDPFTAEGKVEAAQRGLNTGLVYARLDGGEPLTFLYQQDLTALNDYFRRTETKPDGAVGGQWPELGYLPPVTPKKALPGGQDTVISDAFLHVIPGDTGDERGSAARFLDHLASVYRHLERPETEFHLWPGRAEATCGDLETSSKATVREHGYRYVRPYADAEYPDCMVQLTVLLALRDYAGWRGDPLPLADELRRAVPNFFDIQLGTLRRYLPSVGDDKDADQVDSWYLYHPMANLGRLAAEGDEEARDLFLQSVEFGIRVARHFDYRWPVMYHVETLEVQQQGRDEQETGQTDVGGLYAYVTLQSYQLTGEARFLEEAKKAVRAMRELKFDAVYQTNTTAWGTTACVRLWQETGDEFFRDEALVLLASFFHNGGFWESRIKHAEKFPNFLGVTCLHDGPYMAAYECYESFAAFNELLEVAGDAVPESARLLVTEFCRYALTRGWYFYPSELPEEVLATEIRNGHIDRALAFPLEDLYADGQPAGQVGQEIYGCGMAPTFATRAFHRLGDAPFLFYCEYPIASIKAANRGAATFRVWGAPGFTCQARVMPQGKGATAPPVLEVAGEAVAGRATPEGHTEFSLPAGAEVTVRWEKLV